MTSSIFLFATPLASAASMWSANSKKRPSPRSIAKDRTTLDAAGLALLDLVVQDHFDDPRITELQRLHFLSLAWEASQLGELIRAFATSRPVLLVAFAHDLATVAVGVELRASPDHEDLAHCAFLLRNLDTARDRRLFESDWEWAMGREKAAGAIPGPYSLVAYALCAAHRPFGPQRERRLEGDASTALSRFGRWAARARSHDPNAEVAAKDWAARRLRALLDGNAGAVSVPDFDAGACD